jgi:UDP-N-acetylglucosamine--N-acetylmuramyl-(pentapeptide) pyrophosphoryl-undecaprenol N-acetylglucosamine transferase
MVHESNSQLGLANRACLPFIAEVAMGLPLARKPRWPAKVRYELCGTPVRPEFWKLPDAAESRRSLGLDPEKRTLLIFGGSQGALGINQRVPAAVLKLIRSRFGQLQCLHLSGPKNEAAVRESYGNEPSVKVLPYLQEMHRAYAAANLVICRSGASTLAELVAAGKPAVLVPLPTSAGGHQSANARVFADAGAALYVEEKDIAPESLASMLDDLIFSSSGSRSRLQEMSECYGRLRLPAPQETVSLLAAQVEALADHP